MHTEDVSMHGNESWKVVVGGAIYIRKIHGISRLLHLLVLLTPCLSSSLGDVEGRQLR